MKKHQLPTNLFSVVYKGSHNSIYNDRRVAHGLYPNEVLGQDSGMHHHHHHHGLGFFKGISPGSPNSGTPLPIPFPYFKGFLWELYGNGMGVVGSHYWRSLEKSLDFCLRTAKQFKDHASDPQLPPHRPLPPGVSWAVSWVVVGWLKAVQLNSKVQNHDKTLDMNHKF